MTLQLLAVLSSPGAVLGGEGPVLEGLGKSTCSVRTRGAGRRWRLQISPPAFNACVLPSLCPSQLLKAVMEVTDTSAKAVEMAKRQQGEQICWGSSNSVMSLGMWLPLAGAGPACSVVRGRAVPVRLGLVPASHAAAACSTRIWGVFGDRPSLSYSSDA